VFESSQVVTQAYDLGLALLVRFLKPHQALAFYNIGLTAKTAITTAITTATSTATTTTAIGIATITNKCLERRLERPQRFLAIHDATDHLILVLDKQRLLIGCHAGAEFIVQRFESQLLLLYQHL
jgi:hypothetical protein